MIKTPINFLLNSFSKHPNASFFVSPKKTITYKNFKKKVEKLASKLKSCGIKPRMKVLIYSDSDLDIITCYFAIWAIKAIAVPINFSLSEGYLREVENILNPDFILINKKIQNKKFDSTPFVKISEAKTSTDIQIPKSDDLALIMFTSGTSGIPKAVPITHQMVSNNAYQTAKEINIDHSDRIFLNTPSYTTSTIIHVLTLMSVAGSIFMERNFLFGDDFINQIHKYSCSGFGGVPVHFKRLLSATNSLNKKNFSLKFFINSGEHLPVPVIKELILKIPDIKFFCMYGLTEVAGRLCILPNTMLKKKMGSVGLPLKGMDIKILDSKNQECKQETIGEIFITGPNLAKGYLYNKLATQNSFTKFGFASGDIGYKDKDGYLFYSEETMIYLRLVVKRLVY